MKRVLVLLVAAIFLFAGAALAANQTKGGKAAPAKTTSMTASGKVVDISATALKIERSAKGKTETMEFGLDKPASADIKAGDKVTVHYVKKDGKNVATKISKAAAKKPAKKK